MYLRMNMWLTFFHRLIGNVWNTTVETLGNGKAGIFCTCCSLWLSAVSAYDIFKYMWNIVSKRNFTSFTKSLRCTVNFPFRLFPIFVWLWENAAGCVLAEILPLFFFLFFFTSQFWKDCIIVTFCGELDFFFRKCTVVCLSH